MKFDTRAAIAFIVTGGFVAGCYIQGGAPALLLKDIALLVIGFYFGNKATLDKPAE